MDQNTRPVVLARWIDDGEQSYLETPYQQIRLSPEHRELAHKLYRRANGNQSIADMADLAEVQALVTFFEALQTLGACFEAHHLAMAGQQYAAWPDSLRVIPDDQTIRELERLPADPDCNMVQLAGQLDPVLAQRQTTRRFCNFPVDFAAVSSLILAAYGHRGKSDAEWSRTVPSAGAMYPLQLDVFLLNCRQHSGHYRLANHSNRLFLVEGDQLAELEAGFFDAEWRHAAMVVVIGFDIARSSAKYASRAHRFALVEAGHVAQNVITAAATIGLGSWEYGGYRDQELSQALGLNGPTAGIATTLLLGWPA